jgi:3D (Asp-Asp-Asp) domain-containing protein
MQIDLPTLIGSIATAALFVLLSGCDQEESDSGATSGRSQPTQADLAQGQQIAASASGQNSVNTSSATGSGNLSELGGNADQNQEAFRQKFGLTTPTADQLAAWEEYNARLTAYSNKDVDWQYPTASSPNWMDTTWSNGDPLAIEGTTVAVDFNRIPRGSLIYIPALNMYAEANDTGATSLWSRADAKQTDYGAEGGGRVDVYNLAGARSSNQVERDFESSIGTNEYGKIYVVHAGPGWKH